MTISWLTEMSLWLKLSAMGARVEQGRFQPKQRVQTRAYWLAKLARVTVSGLNSWGYSSRALLTFCQSFSRKSFYWSTSNCKYSSCVALITDSSHSQKNYPSGIIFMWWYQKLSSPFYVSHINMTHRMSCSRSGLSMLKSSCSAKTMPISGSARPLSRLIRHLYGTAMIISLCLIGSFAFRPIKPPSKNAGNSTLLLIMPTSWHHSLNF